MLRKGEDGISTGNLVAIRLHPRDDVIHGVAKLPIIRWGNTAQMEIISSAPWWVIYNQEPFAIYVEPQTALQMRLI